MQITNRKFSVEQFEADQQGWIGNLLSPLNLLIQQLFAGFANNITVSENLFQELKSVTFVSESSNFPLTFKTKFQAQPQGLQVVYCQASDGSMPSSYPWPTWSYANGIVTVYSIAGLAASAKYTIKFHLIYG